MGFAYEAVLFDLFGTLVDDEGTAMPGARELLVALPPERWAVVTSCSTRVARLLFDRAKLPAPRTLVSADDVISGKPAPDGYQLAAQRVGAAPEHCLVVEDSAHGIDAGRAAGMDVVAILRGRGSGIAARATFSIPTIASLRVAPSADGVDFEPEG